MSLYVLDTDIVTLYRRGHAAVVRQVLAHPPEQVAITVISVEEQLSGWYALLRRAKKPADLTRIYDRLTETVTFLGSARILSFTEPAVACYEQLRSRKLGIGTMDLRIAAIALAHGATLVTRNAHDFQRIPGLMIEDWTA
jgi:tRNA(fMet)-specific endonuclease VapC